MPSGWLFNEDAALKWLMQGMFVEDINAPAAGRPVKVFFRLPEDEIVTLPLPCVVLSLLDIPFAPERANSGTINLPYAPEGEPIWWDAAATAYNPDASPYRTFFPLPYNIRYQVTVYARLMRDHMVPIISQIMSTRIPARSGTLNIPQDGTFRRIDLMSGPDTAYANFDTGIGDNSQKRLLQTTWMISIPTEIVGPVTVLGPATYPWVSQIDVDLSCYHSMDDLTAAEVAESTGLLSVGFASSWNTQ
jgi:hypothetical protein